MEHPDLPDDVIADICRPLKQPAAQVRYLARLGVTATRRPDGSVLVNREHYNAVRGLGGATTGGMPPGVVFSRRV
jgi:hypothetical protein